MERMQNGLYFFASQLHSLEHFFTFNAQSGKATLIGHGNNHRKIFLI